MRFTTLLLIAAATGCASNPPRPPPVVSASPAAAETEHRVKIDASNVVDVQRAGYKLVNKEGEQLYCRTDAITGSRLQMRTTCLTEQQLANQMNVTKQSMEHISSHQVGPNGH